MKKKKRYMNLMLLIIVIYFISIYFIWKSEYRKKTYESG